MHSSRSPLFPYTTLFRSRIEVYKEWQELMVEEIPVFPTLYRAKLVPVNENIRNYSAVHTDLPHRHLTGFVEGADTSDSSEEADEEDKDRKSTRLNSSHVAI